MREGSRKRDLQASERGVKGGTRDWGGGKHKWEIDLDFRARNGGQGEMSFAAREKNEEGKREGRGVRVTVSSFFSCQANNTCQ